MLGQDLGLVGLACTYVVALSGEGTETACASDSGMVVSRFGVSDRRHKTRPGSLGRSLGSI